MIPGSNYGGGAFAALQSGARSFTMGLMLWRVLTAVLVLFWAVMTGLLLRNAYFPDHSVLAEVPPKLVWDLFLNQAAMHSNTLHVYHHQTKLGHANFHVVKSPKLGRDGLILYRLTASGGVDTSAGEGVKVTAGWRIEADLLDGEELTGLRLDMTSADNGRTIVMRWREGDATPELEVRDKGNLVMDASGALALAGLGSRTGLFGGLLGGGEGKSAPPGLEMTAREGLMDLAGRQRRCFIIRLKAFDNYEMQALFTEVGELARVDLPQGFFLKEPLIHGLEPDLVEH